MGNSITTEVSVKGEVTYSPRSRLYHLEPIGIGTPYVESLTSYLVRLAHKYRIGTRALVLQEIFPLIKEARKLKDQNPIAWFNSPKSINGTTSSVKDWVQAVELLTMYRGLSSLTMLAWSNIADQSGLVRKTRAWCPLCYDDWLQNGTVVYEPLIWNLCVITKCPRHHLNLQNLCSYCRHRIPLLTRLSQPGCCPSCEHRLVPSSSTGVIQEPGGIEEQEKQQWIAHSVGELLTVTPHLSTWPKREKIELGLTAYRELAASENREASPRSVWTSGQKFKGWQSGAYIPRFAILLHLFYTMGISPIQFFTGDAHIRFSDPPRDNSGYSSP